MDQIDTAGGIASLQDRLDSLWADYLDALHSYTNNQERMRKHFADGYFSLARANARSSIGRRYGSDWYDNRTKATLRVSLSSLGPETGDRNKDEPSSDIKIAITEQLQYRNPSEDFAASNKEASSTSTQQPTPPATPASVEHEDDTEAFEKSDQERKLQTNPLFWFGMLPPPTLRTAQSHFRSALLGDTAPDGVLEKNTEALQSSPMAASINAARTMRLVEFEIRKLRKVIGQAERSAQAQAVVS